MSVCVIELTQDVASRGLGVVYESCDSHQKHTLVSALVDTLMTGKRSAARCAVSSVYLDLTASALS